MLKFARKRSSSTDRDLMRNRSSVQTRPRCSSAERTQTASARSRTGKQESSATTTDTLLQMPTLESKSANTAQVRKLELSDAESAKDEVQNKRTSICIGSRAVLAPMTTTLSHLMSQVQIMDPEQQDQNQKPPPVLPRRPKVDNFLQTNSGGHLWRMELLDTSGESGYGTDSSDNNSLKSQDSVDPVPPPLPRRKPRRKVQFDSYVLLMQALKDRDIEAILSTIFNVSSEALCTEDVIYYFHTAILRQDYELTDLLVRAGCEVNTFDHRGWSALHCACFVARLDMIKLLLQNGAAVLARTHHSSETGSQLLPPDNPAFPQCLAYLRCMEECLGTVNSRIVLAAANYKACRVDELGIRKGDRLIAVRRGDVNNEMWWWLRNSRGEEGYVLRDLLALNSRFSQ